MPPIFQSADVNQTDGKIDQIILTHKKIQTRGAEYIVKPQVFLYLQKKHKKGKKEEERTRKCAK
jgi:hypothetical protein